MPDIRGLKRVCASCATRFYDFNKSPIICPKCSAEFTGIVKVRTRRGRNIIDEAKAKAANQDEETPEAAEEDDRTTVSLEEISEEENAGADDDAEEAGDLDLDDLDDEEEDDDLEDLEEEIEVEERE